MYEQLVYVSRAMPEMAEHGLYDIIRVAHNRNSKFGLTGALIFVDGYFLQVLEGDHHDLHARLQIIQADPRHTDVSVRHLIPVNQRTFPEEWMALRHGNAVSDEIKRQFAYTAGFPAAQFDGETLVRFALACSQSFRGTRPAAL
jgi:Sensors of blue-light using FAD